MRPWLALALLAAACSASRPRDAAPVPTASPPPARTIAPAVEPPPAPAAADFTEDARTLYRLVACVDTDRLPASLDARVVKEHCAALLPKIAAYKARYVDVAKPFLRALAPKGLPAKVVYPFSGGDLMTALTTYPDARELTTLSLELAGDVRRVRELDRTELERSLKKLRIQIGELLGTEEYSQSETLKKTQRGDLPGELCFFLVGLAIHGHEPVRLRYFRLERDGAVHHLTQAEIEAQDRTEAEKRKQSWIKPDFSEAFANVEIEFRPRGDAAAPVRVHRHLAQNLANESLQYETPVLRHLEAKGDVAAMVKAASYLLWRDQFSLIRGYLLGHAAFMISDSTGVPPVYAAGAGYVQETYGTFTRSLLAASPIHNADFKRLWASQPKRRLPFRFGYLSVKEPHLLVTRRR